MAAIPGIQPTVTTSPAWYATWFDSPDYHRLYAHRDDREAAGLVDALAGLLRPARHADALDLGCGAGRHSRRLASLGLDVTGIDLSANSISQARRRSRPGLRFERQDMRAPLGRDRFDYVFNLFTSFGYFEDTADHLRVLANVARALRPGGILVLDYLNVAYADARLVAEEVRPIDGTTYRLSRWADGTHFHKRIVVDDPRRPGGPIEHVEHVARLSLADFRRMFARAGLRMRAAYGNYRLGPFDEDRSPRLVMLAQKPGSVSLSARSHAAQRFGRHAEVRREHALRDA
jgi:SAM-dependent methyltransferase